MKRGQRSLPNGIQHGWKDVIALAGTEAFQNLSSGGARMVWIWVQLGLCGVAYVFLFYFVLQGAVNWWLFPPYNELGRGGISRYGLRMR